ncbi:phosphoinositide 3-kinase adapter protein 1 isoform X1 [Cygnus atratus]|uniref:phosphoinositide 3-kinase adapter protein 1 isoform X1 n=1 Tax=Cygnus atratus TaxID=8868 RepID=UPI0015D6256D|nr:phosphoinositide 3-kinase adapter protein 1 isoform X1 [Cygnus atratus]XP_035400997.1 phosphoinositide 3-kinase adapter protein 1 isoform X1 [Cygnus atratus]XP_050568052.1 phosphoinositide 3-kinase adapter protein 1 isoform X1 [Cygnus atratus]
MTAPGTHGGYDVLIVYASDATEWCQYLRDLFLCTRHIRKHRILSYQLEGDSAISHQELDLFAKSRSIIVLLSVELVQSFYLPPVLQSLQEALWPPHKVVKLFCGVTDSDDYLTFFKDWYQWQELTYDDEPDAYLEAVKKAISEDSGCDSVTDTETEDEKNPVYSCRLAMNEEHGSSKSTADHLVVQPDRIRCGVQTTVYIIMKCRLDGKVKTEVEFSPENASSVCVLAEMENEYTISVEAPNLTSGTVSLKIYSGDLMVGETSVTYHTDMEEISSLLANAANPVQFMCQAFKIVPYSIEALDKLLTESLKKNIPASGLHLFGINQLEENDMMTNQRDEELPTLLHFSARYGLKNLTALLLTCPGALQAYSVANKYGHYPNTIAEKHGFKDLRQFIDEYVETADMLKSHIKEELMQGEEDESVYESMAHLSTDLLMKCSLNPGSDEELYESMAGFVPGAPEDLYVEMLQSKPDTATARDEISLNTKDSMLRKFLEGGSMDVPDSEEGVYQRCGEDLYYSVEQDTFPQEMASRPPVPVPRPESSSPQPDNELYISKIFAQKAQRPENLYVSRGKVKKETIVRPVRDLSQSSIYDPFAGMKTPGQRQLITLQEQVKMGILNVDEAVLHFKEWQLNQKKRSESFRFQQENLKRLRDSITRRQMEKQKSGKSTDLEITVPIRHSHNTLGKPECGIYEYTPRKNVFPPKKEIKRGDWKTESTSSTTSSASNRSSTRSILSVSSGMEGDSEDNEVTEASRSRSPVGHQAERLPLPLPERPPRVPPRGASRPVSCEGLYPPPVPPRGR